MGKYNHVLISLLPKLRKTACSLWRRVSHYFYFCKEINLQYNASMFTFFSEVRFPCVKSSYSVVDKLVLLIFSRFNKIISNGRYMSTSSLQLFSPKYIAMIALSCCFQKSKLKCISMSVTTIYSYRHLKKGISFCLFSISNFTKH